MTRSIMRSLTDSQIEQLLSHPIIKTIQKHAAVSIKVKPEEIPRLIFEPYSDDDYNVIWLTIKDNFPWLLVSSPQRIECGIYKDFFTPTDNKKKVEIESDLLPDLVLCAYHLNEITEQKAQELLNLDRLTFRAQYRTFAKDFLEVRAFD